MCKWYLLWGLKAINRTYFGLFGAPGKFLNTNPGDGEVVRMLLAAQAALSLGFRASKSLGVQGLGFRVLGFGV